MLPDPTMAAVQVAGMSLSSGKSSAEVVGRGYAVVAAQAKDSCTLPSPLKSAAKTSPGRASMARVHEPGRTR